MQLEPAAIGGVVVELVFLAGELRRDPFIAPVRVARVLGARGAQRNHVQRRIGGKGLDRELGEDLVGRVQHVFAARRRGVGEDPPQLCPPGQVGVVRVLPPRFRAGGDRQQQRGYVDARAELRPRLARGVREDPAQVLHDQRHARGLLVGARALTAKSMRGAVLAVV